MAPSRREMRRKTQNKEGMRKATKIFRFIQTSLFFPCLNMLHLLPCFLHTSSFAFVFILGSLFWCLLYFVSIYRLTLIQKFIASTFTLYFIAFHEQKVGEGETFILLPFFTFLPYSVFYFQLLFYLYLYLLVFTSM